MKITKHGNLNPKTSIKCVCGNSRCCCEFEAQEHELDGNSSRFCWCPECKEIVWVSEREVSRAVEIAVITGLHNIQ